VAKIRRSRQKSGKKRRVFTRCDIIESLCEVRSLVASPAGLWDSDVRSHESFAVSMRLGSPLRMLVKAGSVVLLWLLASPLADAATIRQWEAGARSVSLCDPHTSPGRLRKHPRSFGGPVAISWRQAFVGLSDSTTRVARGMRTILADDDQAIQNDSPAAPIDTDQHPDPAFRSIGSPSGSSDWRPRTRTFSPRRPRGPPDFGLTPFTFDWVSSD
jgi:hypothetical protein